MIGRLRDLLKDMNILQQIIVLCFIAVAVLFRLIVPIVTLAISGYFILTPDGRVKVVDSIIWQLALTGVSFIGIGTGYYHIKKLVFRSSKSISDRTYWVFVLIAAGLSIYFFGIRNYLIAKPFESHLNEYVSMSVNEGSGFSPITGKAIVMNRVKKNIDSLFSQLPDYLRASNPDEVGTVIWIECSERVTATYISGSKGFQTSCFVTVIDKATATIIGRRIFASAQPPSVKNNPFDYHGEKPTEEIFEFMKNLPTK